MNNSTIENSDKFIDLEKVIRNKNPKLFKFLPRFVLNYLKKIIHEQDLNRMIRENKHLYGLDFLRNVLAEFEITLELKNTHNIPDAENTCIFAANHPIGGIEGLALMGEIGKIYGPVKAVVNDLLLNIENLGPLFVGVNKLGANSRQKIEELDAIFDSSVQIVYFPAGLVSRRKKGIIEDPEWKKTFVSRAVRHHRNIVPVYVEGRLSNFFYNLARIRTFLKIKINIEMLFLVNEMFKQKGKKISFIFGTPIAYTKLDKSNSDKIWAEKIKKHVYRLALNPDADFE